MSEPVPVPEEEQAMLPNPLQVSDEAETESLRRRVRSTKIDIDDEEDAGDHVAREVSSGSASRTGAEKSRGARPRASSFHFSSERPTKLNSARGLGSQDDDFGDYLEVKWDDPHFNFFYLSTRKDQEPGWTLKPPVLMLLLVFCIGAGIGVINWALHQWVHFVQHFWMHDVLKSYTYTPAVENETDSRPSAFTYAAIFFGLIASAVICGVLTRYVEPECAGGGSLAIKAAIAYNQPVTLRAGIIRFVLTGIYLGFLNPLGVEAPTLQVVAAWGCFVYQLFGSVFGSHWFPDKHLHLVIVCTVGAGAAAAFNCPIGGVLYAIEEYRNIVAQSPQRTLVVLTISVVAVQYSRQILGSAFFFQNFNLVDMGLQAWMLLCFPFGCLLGGLGVFFQKLTLTFRAMILRRQQKSEKMARIGIFAKGFMAALVSFAVGGLSCFLTEAFMNKHANTTQQNGFAVWGTSKGALEWFVSTTWAQFPRGYFWFVIAVFTFLKVTVVSFSVAAGGNGGIFAPTLVIGGLAGLAFALLIGDTFGCSNPPFLSSTLGTATALDDGNAATVDVLFQKPLDEVALHGGKAGMLSTVSSSSSSDISMITTSTTTTSALTQGEQLQASKLGSSTAEEIVNYSASEYYAKTHKYLPWPRELRIFPVLGMAGLFSAVIRTPIAAVVIVQEMIPLADRQELAQCLPVVLAFTSAVAFLVARSLQPEDIWDQILEQDGCSKEEREHLDVRTNGYNEARLGDLEQRLHQEEHTLNHRKFSTRRSTVQSHSRQTAMDVIHDHLLHPLPEPHHESDQHAADAAASSQADNIVAPGDVEQGPSFVQTAGLGDVGTTALHQRMPHTFGRESEHLYGEEGGAVHCVLHRAKQKILRRFGVPMHQAALKLVPRDEGSVVMPVDDEDVEGDESATNGDEAQEGDVQ
ncbi:unnamed protein product [Amoebophrya sp. A120]|nr:unnamed protein product [Amoebophrya sp. A120]|eukprot:GSA120T00006387001.1